MVPFWCQFLDPHLITYHLNVGVQIIVLFDLGMSTLHTNGMICLFLFFCFLFFFPSCFSFLGLGPSIRPATSANVQGYSHTLSGWMKEFRGSSEHYEALQDAIQNGPEYLACDKMGVSISPHIDFGLKHTGVTLYSLTLYL